MKETTIRERFTPFPVLQTERLVLRQLQLTDVEEIYKLRTDRGVNRYIPRAPLLHKDDAVAFIVKINEGLLRNKWVYWAIRLHDKPKLVGTICLWNFSGNEVADIGYELLPDFCNQGIMIEALNCVVEYASQTLKLNRLEAHTIASNKRSTNLLTKSGFQLIMEPEQELEYNEVLYFLNLR